MPIYQFPRAFKHCVRCGKAIKDKDSIAVGLGADCYKKTQIQWKSRNYSLAEIPFDASTGNVVCARKPVSIQLKNAEVENFDNYNIPAQIFYKASFNVSQGVQLWGRAGFEFGYKGPGPDDFSLNVLNWFIPPVHEREKPPWFESLVRMPTTGAVVSRFAVNYAERFTTDFVAPMPREGATLPGELIKLWINARLHEVETSQLRMF